MSLVTRLGGRPFPLMPPPPQSPTRLGDPLPHGPQLTGLPPAWFAKCNKWHGGQAGATLGRKNPSAREKLESQLSSFPGAGEKSQEKAGLWRKAGVEEREGAMWPS